MTTDEVVRRLDQALADQRMFIQQRFADAELLRVSERRADNRLLDERWNTQSKSIDSALTAAEKARVEALSTQREDSTRLSDRIKSLEDMLSNSSGRVESAREMKTDTANNRIAILMSLGLVASLVGGYIGHLIH